MAFMKHTGEGDSGGRGAAVTLEAGRPTVRPAAPDKILIIDDNDINRQVLMGILRKEGYALLQAADGAQALAAARREHPDLVLLDIMMPLMDGYEVCSRLKKDPSTADIPVIFLSALTETANKVKGLDLGAVDYITKPFDQAEVLARVRSHLKIRHLTQELVAANRDLLEKQENLDRDLEAARDIQVSLIPRAAPVDDAVHVRWIFEPCDRIGGDVFNLYRLDDRHLVAYVVDVSGHGVPAAMVTVSVSQSLSPLLGYSVRREGETTGGFSIPAPSEVLAGLDREYPIERFEKYFTICYLVFDLATGHVRYSRAGHPMPIVVRRDGQSEMLAAGGTIIGLGSATPFEEGEVTLRTGDRLYLYTDGILEQENGSGEMYGEERLAAELRAGGGESIETVCERVMESMRRFGASERPQDDITLVAIEFRGVAGMADAGAD